MPNNTALTLGSGGDLVSDEDITGVSQNATTTSGTGSGQTGLLIGQSFIKTSVLDLTQLKIAIRALVNVHHSIYPQIPPQGNYFEALVEEAFRWIKKPFTPFSTSTSMAQTASAR